MFFSPYWLIWMISFTPFPSLPSPELSSLVLNTIYMLMTSKCLPLGRTFAEFLTHVVETLPLYLDGPLKLCSMFFISVKASLHSTPCATPRSLSYHLSISLPQTSILAGIPACSIWDSIIFTTPSLQLWCRLPASVPGFELEIPRWFLFSTQKPKQSLKTQIVLC